MTAEQPPEWLDDPALVREVAEAILRTHEPGFANVKGSRLRDTLLAQFTECAEAALAVIREYAPQAAPEASVVTEWGARYAGGEVASCGWIDGVSERFARDGIDPDPFRVDQRALPVEVVTRTRTTYTDYVTEWTPADTDGAGT